MACDKHIVLVVLILVVTVIVMYVNITTIVKKEEPKKFLTLTKEEVRSNALKRVKSKVNFTSNKSNVALEMYPYSIFRKELHPPKTQEVLNLNSIELKIHPPMKMFYENYMEVIKFEVYLKRFNKSYSGREWHRRFWNFKQSLRELYQGSDTGARHGLTKFSDWSKKEFAKAMNNTSYRNYGECRSQHMPCPPISTLERGYHGQLFDTKSFGSHLKRDINGSLDWRQKGNVIGPVLNQKLCNGCWAFGIIGLMESMAVIQGKEPYVRRSIQELLDCAMIDGCNGGHVTHALQYLCSYDLGVETEEQYPLLLVNEKCKQEIKPDPRKIKEFSTDCNMKEMDILRKLQHGPVIAVINAGPLKNYIDGTIQRSCYRSKDGESIDHVVQIIGYNLNDTIPHYIVKNSWGSGWGEDGYFKLKYGENLCGVADEVTYLEVN